MVDGLVSKKHLRILFQTGAFRRATSAKSNGFVNRWGTAFKIPTVDSACGLKTDERMHKACALAAKKPFLPEGFRSSHAVMMPIEARPAVPLLLLSYDSEFAAVVLT